MKESEGQVIQYIDGYAWGVTPSGGTACLGTEPDIRAILANPRKHPSNPTIAQVISLERQLIKNEQKKEQVVLEQEATMKKERHQQAIEMGVARKHKSRQNK